MGHSVPCNCHTHQGKKKAFLKCLFPPPSGLGMVCGLQASSGNRKHGWRKKTMVVGGVWQRQTPHGP